MINDALPEVPGRPYGGRRGNVSSSSGIWNGPVRRPFLVSFLNLSPDRLVGHTKSCVSPEVKEIGSSGRQEKEDGVCESFVGTKCLEPIRI